MAKFEIRVSADKCTGCMICQLACSDRYAKAYNPSLSRIQVTLSGTDCRIVFSDECEKCGMCADACFYGTLEKISGEGAA